MQRSDIINAEMDGHGLGIQNEAGERLVEFCDGNNLGIMNTWFERFPDNSARTIRRGQFGADNSARQFVWDNSAQNTILIL